MVFCIHGHFSVVLYVPGTHKYPKRLVNFDPLHMGGNLSREQLSLLHYNQDYLGLDLFVKDGEKGKGRKPNKSDLFSMEVTEGSKKKRDMD